MNSLIWINSIGITHYIALAIVLFVIGILGVLTRRNIVVVMMSIELMLNAINLSFVAFARELNQLDGQIVVFFVMTIAAAEAAVGLALVVSVFKRFKEVNIRFFEHLKG
jgi:NADH-quinone oxidoreductase subunit K